MKNVIVTLLVLIGSTTFAQVSVSVGPSMLLGTISEAKPWAGFHVGVEVPRDDQVTIYGRFTHHFKQYAQDSISTNLTPLDPNDFSFPIVNGRTSMNYNILEGGTRYYIGNGFDFGWAAYGGTNIMILINSVKHNFSNFDESKYKVNNKGTIFGLGAGLSGGVKYTFPRFGTIYTDVNLNYILLGTSSTPPPSGELFSPLVFNFNIGYRRDLIW